MPLPTLNLHGTTSIRAVELQLLDEAWASVVSNPKNSTTISIQDGNRRRSDGSVGVVGDGGGGTVGGGNEATTATVIVEGPSGAGKTFLVQTWHQKYQQQRAGSAAVLVVYGKFNQIQEYAQPYQALVQAMEQLLSQVSVKNTTTRLRDLLRERLGSDVLALMDFVPALAEMTDWGGQPPGKTSQQQRRPTRRHDHISRSQAGGGEGAVTTDDSEQDHSSHPNHSNDESSSHGSPQDEDSGGQQYAFDRFAFLFRELLQCILTVIPHFVMFIDDIQWADDNSLELLRTMVADPQLYGVLLIMTARSRASNSTTSSSNNGDNSNSLIHSDGNNIDSVDVIQDGVVPAAETEDGNISTANSTRLAAFFEKITGLLASVGKKLNRVQLQNLTMDQVNELVSAATELSPPTCLPLSQIVHSKTSGNFLFVIQFLDSLQRRQLLRYSLQQYRWTWDVDEIRGQTDLADNVAALVAERVFMLHAETQWTLRLAAYLGHSFHLEDIVRLVHGIDLITEVFSLYQYPVDLSVDPDQRSRIELRLQEAVDAGLLDVQNDSRYKFAHDSIQQLFLSIESDNAVGSNFDLRVGVILLGFFRSTTGMDWMLFASVQVLNRGRAGLGTDDSKLTLAKLNLTAAKKACKKNGFFPASDYLQVAIELVSDIDQIWEKHYPFILSLYVLSSEVELTCGRHDRCKVVAETVFAHSLAFDDRVRAYFALATSLRVQSKYGDALELLLEVLDRMGEKHPRKPGRLGLALSAYETRRLLAKVSDEEIQGLPVITKRRDRSKMRFLNMLYMNAYYQERTEVGLVVMRRMICRTLQLGLCESSPLAFVAYAHRLSCSGNFDEGCHYGEIASKLIDQLKARDNLAISTFFLACFVDHLKKPMYQTLPGLDRGFQVGMEVGDVESAFLCATTDLSYRTALASPLQDLMQKSISFFRQAQAYGQTNIAVEFLLMWQFTANLMGLSRDPLVFDGEYMHEEKLMEPVLTVGTLARSYYIFLKTQCAFYMGEWEEARRLLEMVYRHERQIMVTHYNFGVAATLAGVIYFKLYSRTEDLKVLAKAEDAMKFLKLWVAKGAINVAAGLFFVEALQSTVRRKDLASVKASFDRAIVALHRCAFRHWEALACESFAEYALEQHDDRDYASDYLKRAYELFRAWGALAKTRQLEAKHADLLQGINTSATVANLARAFEEPNKAIRRSTWWSTNTTTINQ